MSTFIFQPVGQALDGSDVAGNIIRHVGSSAPTTTSWNAGDIWMDTIQQATSLTPRVWTGTAFAPARGTGGGSAALLNDLFTGSDGASLTNWVTGVDPSTGTGSSATIQGNMGRLTTSTTGGFVDTGRIARKANITNPTDANMVFSFKFDATEPGVRAWMRAENTMAADHGYYIEIEKGVWSLNKALAGTPTKLAGDFSFGYSDGILYSARLRVVGTTVQAKVWAATDAEPAVWGATATDSAVTAAGAVGFDVINGNGTAVVANFFIDTVTIEAT